MKNQVREAVLCAFRRLLCEDGYLFDCPVEENPPYGYDPRKLHEICINHRLANHLQEEIIPLVECDEPLFVDIEFNREGINFKHAKIGGKDELVRPDIIIHNRRTDTKKFNFLVVECKKNDANQCDIRKDCKRIRALMTDKKYEYRFGLQVIYGKDGICGTLFFKNGTNIESEPVNHPA